MRYFGADTGGIEEGDLLQINSIQIMPTDGLRWVTKDINETKIDAIVSPVKTSGVKRLLIHAIYLINLARQDNQMFHLSKLSLASYLKYAQEIMNRTEGSDFEVLGVTFHPGSAKDLTPEEGLKRISEGINWIFEQVPGNSMLLLESSAGAGAVMGDTFEELAKMREGVEKKERVGYVIDTQHTFVSGYDWINDLDGIVEKMDKVLGLENVRCFHLNDSMMEFNSHKDRHADLGKGKIGLEAIKKLVNHPKLKNIPFILETPALKTFDTAKEEVDLLRGIIL